MKKLVPALISLVAACSCPANTGVQTAEVSAGDWTIYIAHDYSKPSEAALLPAATPLENYKANLERISPRVVDSIRLIAPFAEPTRFTTHPFDAQSLTVAELGPWYDYVVFDVSNKKALHRSLVLKEKSGNHRILFTQMCGSTLEWKAPFFVTASGHTLLAYRGDTGGSGNYKVEYYFIFDPETQLPRALDLSVIDDRIAEMLPEGRAVRMGGGFDVKTLTYHQSVWELGDANCCPSAGRIKIRLAIENCRLAILEASYDPSGGRRED